MLTNEARHPERIIPDEVPPGILALHLKRYVFASQWCQGKKVLDVACGAGYGAHYLAHMADRVVGVDISEEAIAYAVQHYASPNLCFELMDARYLALKDETFDVVCSFETIEHLDGVDTYLHEVVRVLKSEGVLIVSTPNATKTTLHPDNPFHQQEWSAVDFRDLLRGFFGEVAMYGQTRRRTRLNAFVKQLDFLALRSRIAPQWLVRAGAHAIGTRTTTDLTLEDIVIIPENLSQATEIVAVCSQSCHPLGLS